MEVFWPFLVIAALALVDYVAARRFVPAYFRFGIPLIRIRLVGVRLDPEAEWRLESAVEHRASRITFERLSESEIAFREQGGSAPSFRYMPIMHGLLRYVPEEGATYVIGWLNYFAIAAFAFMGWLFADAPSFRKPWDLLAMFAMVFGAMILVGVVRYRHIANALRSTGVQTAQPTSPAR